MAGALLASGCSILTSFDGWTIGDEDQQDAGPMDAGRMDAGPMDAGPGEEDAGPDCAAGLTECGGECVDLDSSSEHCGECGSACPTPPNTVALCSAGSCSFECAAGFDDCNGDPEDGCEVEIASDPLNCGGCALTCETALSCREGTCRPRPRWARAFGDTGFNDVQGVALDPEGNVYIISRFVGTINLGGDDLVSAGDSDIFVASFTADGEHRWSVDGGGPSADYPGGIAFDRAGKVHVTGSFTEDASFDESSILTNNGGTDFFIASFDAATGSHLGSRAWGGAEDEFVSGIAVDSSGNIYVTGSFYGRVNFGGEGVASSNLTSAGERDIFVVSYPPSYASTEGRPRWAKRFGDTDSDGSSDIAVDAIGNVYVTGDFKGSVRFGNFEDPTFASEGYDVFIASFNSSGAHRWSTTGGGSSDDWGGGIASDDMGNVYVTAMVEGAASFGGALLAHVGQMDIVLASYDASGAHRWSRAVGGPQTEQAFHIAGSSSGEVYLTGYSEEGIDFGGGPLNGESTANFVAALQANNGTHGASFVLGGPDGSVQVGPVAVGAGLFCIGGGISGSVRIGEETLIAISASDALIACFEP